MGFITETGHDTSKLPLWAQQEIGNRNYMIAELRWTLGNVLNKESDVAYDQEMLALLERAERLEKQGKGKIELVIDFEPDTFTEQELRRLRRFYASAYGVEFQRLRLASLKG